MQGDTLQFLQQVLNNANGPSATPQQIQRVQLWDLFSCLPFYNDSNLNGSQAVLFNFTAKQQVFGPGFQSTSPAYQASLADTNIDAPGNIPFDMFIHGISFDIINRQQISGTVGTANDMATWAMTKAAYLVDTQCAFNINNLDVDLFQAVEAPAGAGPWGFASQGTSAALTTGASISTMNNGWPSAGNYRNYASEGPFFCPKNTTIQFKCNFGNSWLAANTTYAPVHTGAPVLFLKATLRGFRIWYAQ